MGGTRLLVNRFLGDNSDFLKKIERKNLCKTELAMAYMENIMGNQLAMLAIWFSNENVTFTKFFVKEHSAVCGKTL